MVLILQRDFELNRDRLGVESVGSSIGFSLPDVQEQPGVIGYDCFLQLEVIFDQSSALMYVLLVLLLLPKNLLPLLLQLNLPQLQFLMFFNITLQREVFDHIFLVVIEILTLRPELFFLLVKEFHTPHVFFIDMVAKKHSFLQNFQPVFGYAMGFTAQGDCVAVELVADRIVDEGYGPDELNDNLRVLGFVFAGGDDPPLIVLGDLHQFFAELVVHLVHIGHQLPDVLDVPEDLGVVIVDFIEETGAVDQKGRDCYLISHIMLLEITIYHL